MISVEVFFIPLFFIPLHINDGKKFKNNVEFLSHIGVVIPCHKSGLEIGRVLEACLQYIDPANIVVCDNGNMSWPSDNTFEVCRKIHPKIQYIFIQQGHKTRAL